MLLCSTALERGDTYAMSFGRVFGGSADGWRALWLMRGEAWEKLWLSLMNMNIGVVAVGVVWQMTDDGRGLSPRGK